MVNNKSLFYTERFLKFISIFSIFSVALLSFRTGHRIFDLFKHSFEYSCLSIIQLYKYYFIIIENLIFICFFIFLIFKPQKFILIGIISLLYSFDNLLSNFQAPYLGIPMFTLCVTTFAIRGFFLENKKIKVAIFSLIYIIMLFLPILYDENFCENFITKIAISTVTLATLFFSIEFAKQSGSKKATIDKVLNIASFHGLDRSDLFLLQEVLNYTRYKEIAQKIHGSEGALRNKLSKIYKILEVGDRTGFLTIYSGYKLIYEPEYIKDIDFKN